MTTANRSRPRFLFAAFAFGTSFGSAMIVVPLLVLARGGGSAVVGALIGFLALGTAVASVATGRIIARIGADEGLVLALAGGLVGLVLILIPGPFALVWMGCGTIGFGMGAFWVSSQTWLGTAGGGAFVRHYACYTAGTALGGPGAGLFIRMIQVGSQETPGEVRISTLIGISVLVAAIALWPPHRRVRVEKPEALHARSNVPWQARLRGLVTRGVHLQTSDLMLVIGFNFLLTVQPILLRREFDLEPGIVGLAAGGVALAKVTGGFLGNRLAARFGATAALPTLIVISGVAIVLSPLTSHPGIYVALSLTAIVLGLGQWAIVVSSAVDRMDADHRPALIGSWNLREFGVIAVASTTSGWMLDAVGPRTVLVLGGVITIGAGLTVRQLLTIPRTDQHPELVHPN